MHATKDYIIHNAIDLIFDFNDLRPLLNQIPNYDITIFERNNRQKNDLY